MNYTVRRDWSGDRWVYTMDDGSVRYVTDEEVHLRPPIVDESGAPLLRGVLTEEERTVGLGVQFG